MTAKKIFVTKFVYSMFDDWGLTVKETKDINFTKILNQVEAAFGHTWIGYIHTVKANNKEEALNKSRKQIRKFIDSHEIADVMKETDILKLWKYHGLSAEEFKMLLDYHIMNEPPKESVSLYD